MIGVVLVPVVLLGLLVLFARRARRKRELAGLSSVRPVFSVEPPTRRHGRLKDGHL